MDMTNAAVKIKQIKLNYNKSKMQTRAVIFLDYGDGRLPKPQYEHDLNIIIDRLKAFSKQENRSVASLIMDGSIPCDNNLLGDSGVIIYDKDNNYHRIVFNPNDVAFSEKRLTRMEKKALGLSFDDDILKEDSESDTFESIKEDDKTFFDKDIVVDSSNVSDTTLSSPSLASNDEKMNKDEFIDSTVEVKGEKDTINDERAENDKKNKIGVKFLKIGAKALAIIATGVVLVHVLDNPIKHRNTDSSDEKNNSNEDSYNDSVSNLLSDTTFTTEEPSVINESYVLHDDTVIVNNDVYENGKYIQYGSIISEDMDTQVQHINDSCFEFVPHNFENIVVDTDKHTIAVISEARNHALNNQYDLNDLLDQYIKYIFEGGTMFNGNVVKSFDYLSPYAQYIVLVSGESMLHLRPDYNYSTSYDTYTYGDVIERFDNHIDQIYRELHVNSKTL